MIVVVAEVLALVKLQPPRLTLLEYTVVSVAVKERWEEAQRLLCLPMLKNVAHVKLPPGPLPAPQLDSLMGLVALCVLVSLVEVIELVPVILVRHHQLSRYSLQGQTRILHSFQQASSQGLRYHKPIMACLR